MVFSSISCTETFYYKNSNIYKSRENKIINPNLFITHVTNYQLVAYLYLSYFLNDLT